MSELYSIFIYINIYINIELILGVRKAFRELQHRSTLGNILLQNRYLKKSSKQRGVAKLEFDRRKVKVSTDES